jgi:hypothetical protein
MIKGVAWVPVSTAKRQLSVTKQRVYELIRDGRLVSMELDGTVLVSQESIQARIDALQGRLGV